MTVITVFKEGSSIFGILFPILFLTAVMVLSIIIYESLCRIGHVGIIVNEKKLLSNTLDGLCTLATLTGSLQTIISLCIVGFSIWFGAMQVGSRAFAILIQGFASTGFGIAVAIIGEIYLRLFHGKGREAVDGGIQP